MSLDRNLKRAFPVVVLGGLGLVAYFQARGIGHLIGSSMTETSAPVPAGSAGPAPAATERDGSPILDRNPFGPEASPEPSSATATPNEESPTETPADGGACDFGRVVLITSSDDPRWSFASIAGKDGGVKMRRLGDEVDGYEVDEIISTRVWLKKDGRRCFLQMGSSAATGSPKEAEKTADATDWKKQIRRLTDSEVVIERAAAEAIAASPSSLMGVARMRPEREGDQTVGLRLSRVRQGSLLDALGLQNGDRLESINGQALDDPRKVMELYERLAKLERWSVRLVRDGAPRTIAYRIR